MSRNVSQHLCATTLLAIAAMLSGSPAAAANLSPAQRAIQSAADNNQYTFVMFHRRNDAATQGMIRTVQSTLGNRPDAVIVSVQIGDAAEAALIERFDATRMPMPAVAALAPNGAVTGVFPQRVAPQQLTATIVSPGQAGCLKALQDGKLVLLCVQPDGNEFIPAGVRDFQADQHFRDRTQVVSIQANDPAEQRFLRQLEVPANQPATVTAFMAPPGVMLGTYKANVTLDVLAQRLAAAGKCCDDPNCKHHR